MLESKGRQIKGVHVCVEGANLMILSHVIFHTVGQKQSLCAVKFRFVSALVHLVFHLGISFRNK